MVLSIFNLNLFFTNHLLNLDIVLLYASTTDEIVLPAKN